MNKEEFFQKNDAKMLALGFSKVEDDPEIFYSKNLISDEVIEENALEPYDIAKLIVADTGVNKGAAIFIGSHFLFLNVAEIEEAIEIAEKIYSIEPSYV
ncbi:hypothetical protein [Sphingobacterium kyonggiense]